jgi:hypothetical protein
VNSESSEETGQNKVDSLVVFVEKKIVSTKSYLLGNLQHVILARGNIVHHKYIF